MKKLNSVFVLILVLVSLNSKALSAAGNINDLSYIGVGARPLGMGNAYVGLAENADAVFVNPAGLGKSNSLKLTSMYTNLLGDVNYFVVSGSHPLDIGSLGVGVVSARIDNIPILLSNAADKTHYPVVSSFGNYSNSTVFISYGFPLEKVIPDYGKNIYLGSTLKYFDQTGSGTEDATKASGRGMDLDVGVLYEPTKWLSVGLNQQNTLPANLGAIVTFKSGIEEGIPSVTKAGIKAQVLGNKENSAMQSSYKLNVLADADISKNKPSAVHIGAELWPTDMLAIRAGLDQDSTPATVDPAEARNFTFGVGLKFRGIGFDYAYHPYSGIKENTTHYFSISFIGEEEKPSDKKPKQYLTVVKPRDRMITHKDSINVIGILDKAVEEVKVNDKDIAIDIINGEKTFNTKVPLDGIGKKLIVISAYDRSGKLLEVHKRRIIRLAKFSDVADEYWAKEQIEYAATAGLMSGYPDGTFQPNKILTRAELSAMLIKIMGGSDANAQKDKSSFKDISSSNWALKYINAANNQKIVLGYPDKTFRPNKEINRIEGISVAVRFDGSQLITPERDPYSDVKKNHWAASAIETAKENGFLDYINSDLFEPLKGLARAEAVEIFSKTSYGKERIEDLFDWKKGFEKKSLSKNDDEG